MHCIGVILAGGAAVRYGGRPKGLETVAGTRIVDRVRDALAAACDDLLLIANDPEADRWLPGVRTERDVLQGIGSVAGIHAALAHAGSSIVSVAWDMPFVPSSLLLALRTKAASERSDVVVPESDSRRGLEPMCAFYGPACLAAIERAIARQDRRIVAFFDDVRVTRIPADEVARYGDPAHIFMNVNTPEDLARAEQYAASAAPGHSRA